MLRCAIQEQSCANAEWMKTKPRFNISSVINHQIQIRIHSLQQQPWRA
jgi:hypothetical protein